MKRLMVIYSDSSDFWMGRGWLVVEDEGEPAIASFETEAEAIQYAKAHGVLVK